MGMPAKVGLRRGADANQGRKSVKSIDEEEEKKNLPPIIKSGEKLVGTDIVETTGKEIIMREEVLVVKNVVAKAVCSLSAQDTVLEEC